MSEIDDKSYEYKEIVPYLVDWFGANARILPWRLDPTPYHVWVSEIMLQQTRVEAVRGYYDRFLTALPTIEDLANASEETILKLWEGLGYYTRVRNLQKAAVVIVNEYDGKVPDSYEQLLKLPGIGTYTAGAIASIAYGIPVAAVDGNVFRIAHRLSGSFADITKASVKKQLETDFAAIIPEDAAGAFNQSLMDLGATVCIPNGKPLCEKCPVMHLCIAFKKGLQAQIPVKPKKKGRKIEDKTVFVLEYKGKIALHKRPKSGLLAGLWELPNIEGKSSIDKAQDMLKQFFSSEESDCIELTSLGEKKHIFSHIEWHMTGIHIKFTKSEQMELFCGQLGKNDDADVDNSTVREESNYKENSMNSYRIVPYKEVEESYALPSAFEGYKIW
ncbi:A/G-specific adenine glycosylase [Anaerosporobacter sp.]|uniref:A/G-specific adenine glycosylase n=1 Tax=Anaerosporobacter sp. TaxID=1872529 RepID=UPI00286F63C7|nr:A/G-specific adenine glycosylase [Anaerosporobacter sp.]